MTQNTQLHSFRFKGQGAEFFGIWIVNLLLSILTLGIYSAWAKVRTHRYFYGNTELDGDHFEYLATPRQILIGRIVTVLVLLLWGFANNASPILAMVLGLLFAVLMPVLVVRNLRFDARVTRFRNVRFDFAGGYGPAYANLLGKPLAGYLAVGLAVTLAALLGGVVGPGLAVVLAVLVGLLGMVCIYAWVSSSMAQYLMSGYRYGDKAFSAEVAFGEYFKIGALAALIGIGLMLAIVTVLSVVVGINVVADMQQLGAHAKDPQMARAMMPLVFGFYLSFFVTALFVSAFVKAKVRNYLFSCTQIEGGLQLVSNMKPLSYLGLVLTNLLLVVFTLGFGSAWARVRYARFLADCTAVEGDLALVAVQDHQHETDVAIADELASAFDVQIGVL
ncbi:YjgN family protein [Gallaecimonas kandeliae]|uniref:YjgN family protein n=1 Tax=Gallaecimonas kandeliae TaxID=3029055 RepID=UPI002648CC2F|nr:YjgN family protein [Gallaecimonas kandeliae]WKE65400.1 YjgN family protein [Gallaecimonas kandeliae]